MKNDFSKEGKTELMRQLVSWMEQEEVKCQIAAEQRLKERQGE